MIFVFCRLLLALLQQAFCNRSRNAHTDVHPTVNILLGFSNGEVKNKDNLVLKFSSAMNAELLSYSWKWMQDTEIFKRSENLSFS